MPVLPLVASMMVLPAFRAPDLRPAWIMLRAGRSLTEPPGLNHSALAQNSTFGKSLPMRSSLSNGVLPMHSRSDLPGCAVACGLGLEGVKAGDPPGFFL